MPVTAVVARRLAAPLDLVVVRKIGVPGQPELAMGAVVEGTPPVALRNENVIRMLAIRNRDFDRVRDREIAEIERRRQAFLPATRASTSAAAPSSWSTTALPPAG